MVLPVVVDFGRWPVGSVVTVSTVLDDPDRPAATPRPTNPDHAAVRRRQCRKCRRWCRTELRDGLGPRCWARINGQRRRSGDLRRTPAPRPARHDGPDLLDLLCERGEQGRPAAATDGCSDLTGAGAAGHQPPP